MRQEQRCTFCDYRSIVIQLEVHVFRICGQTNNGNYNCRFFLCLFLYYVHNRRKFRFQRLCLVDVRNAFLQDNFCICPVANFSCLCRPLVSRGDGVHRACSDGLYEFVMRTKFGFVHSLKCVEHTSLLVSTVI